MPCHAGIAAVERLETVQLPRWPGIAAVERRRTAALEAWQSSALLLPWPSVRVVRGQLYCAPGGYDGRLATFQGSALQLLLGRRRSQFPCIRCGALSPLLSAAAWHAFMSHLCLFLACLARVWRGLRLGRACSVTSLLAHVRRIAPRRSLDPVTSLLALLL